MHHIGSSCNLRFLLLLILTAILELQKSSAFQKESINSNCMSNLTFLILGAESLLHGGFFSGCILSLNYLLADL